MTEELYTTYKYQNLQIEVLPYFLYEVNLYRIYSNHADCLSSKYYTSNKLLNIKEVKVLKRFNKFHIDRFITLLGAPLSFIQDNNLPIYELKKKNHEKRTH